MRTSVSTPDGADLCVEAFGDEGAPVLLLIGGIGWAMDHWEDGFCERLVRAGLRVVRYDHRDTGASSSWPPGEPGYTHADLRDDPIAVLDGLGVQRAHLLGLSMGGGIAQELALAHRDRVRSLTLVMTSFARDTPGGLPGPTDALADEPPEPDWDDAAAVVDYLVAAERPYAGPGTFDEPRARALTERIVARTTNPQSAAKNHSAAASGAGAPGAHADLASLPVLVVHGTHDPLFPIEHGRALAEALDAPLLELEGMGHQRIVREHWDRLAESVAQLASEA